MKPNPSLSATTSITTVTFDIPAVLRAPPACLRERYGAFVIRIAESLATGLATGVGFAIVRALAG